MPSGERRYWDGVTWVDLPDPEAHEPVGSETKASTRRPRKKWLVIAVATTVLILGAAVAVVSIGNAREEARLSELAAIAEAEDEVAASEELAALEEAAAEEQAALESAEEAARQAELESREEQVPEIEDSIRAMANEHVDEGFIDGPILEVFCSPVGGGSMEDLTQQTTVFECFVANEETSTGTYSGYYYNATMNWSTGTYTYGYGQP